MKPEERQRGDFLVAEKILGHQWYYKAKTVLLFLNYGSEIDTSMLFEDAWQKGKRVYVPKIEGEEMHFYQITHMEQVYEGYKGIREPISNALPFCYQDKKEDEVLMIMPGVAFDRYRNRLGYGKGFYDRYLRDKERINTIAIGYKCQMVEELPYEETDIRPNQIICF